MKKRFLPIGFLSLLILGLIVLFVLPSTIQEGDTISNKKGAQTIAGAKKYLASIRNNQHTGLLNPADVINARAKMESQSYKSSEMMWNELGPDNVGGRTRALIFDNRDADAETMYAGSVTGGIFKTTNLGATWIKVNKTSGTANLNVSCMVQTDDGKIYAGTGEGLSTENYTGTGLFGYEGGFVGKGLFVSDNDDNFTLVEGTAPVLEEDVAEWAYINELAIDKANNRLFAATNTGLKYASLPNLDDWSGAASYTIDSLIVSRNIEMDSLMICDSITNDNGDITIYGSTGWQVSTTRNDTSSVEEIHKSYVPFETQGNCYDVKVNADGVIIAMFNNKVYVSGDGNVEHFVNRSIYPDNPESTRQDEVNWLTKLTIKNKDGEILHETEINSQETIDWHTDYYLEAESSTFDEYPHATAAGRTEFAVAPSDQNVMYAIASAASDNSLLSVYLSVDAGMKWRVVAPGGSNSLNILGAYYNGNQGYYQGDFSNTISVFPNDPYRILCGGVDLWVGKRVNTTGPYYWARRSESDASPGGGLQIGTFDPLYVHMDHHVYTFRPGFGNRFAAGTDGGVYLGTVTGDVINFAAANTGYNCTQFYSFDMSFVDDILIGGSQDNGPLLLSSNMFGIDMWHGANIPYFFPDGTDGGSVAISNLMSFGPGPDDQQLPTSYYSRTEHPEGQGLVDRMRRSETLSEDFAVDFISGPADNNFITPMLLWEDYNNENSRDSVKFTADAIYSTGDNVIVRSNNIKHPFNYTLPIDMEVGDTLMVKDIISSKLFIATTNNIWMSIDAYDFTVAPSWWKISASNNAGFEGTPLSLAVASDGNQLYVGTQEGQVYRISNIALAYNEDRADVGSTNCIIATHELDLGGNTQAVTALAIDPSDANKLIVCLGNYGNTDYIHYSNNALSDNPSFTSVQDGLPTAPVYAAIFEMDPETDQVIVGTEMGLYACDDINTAEWYRTGSDIGEVPVMAIKQQTKYKGSFTITTYDPVTNEPFYEYFYPIINYGDIYVATHGRGVFKADMNYVGVEENVASNISRDELNMSIYPNPAIDNVTLNLNIEESSNAQMLIFDLSGKQILTMDLGMLTEGHNKIPVDVSKLVQGTYMMQVTVGTSTATSKIIIK
jgi:hypothetical protein